MGGNKYIITKIKCWPVFKQDPNEGLETPKRCENIMMLIKGRT